MRRKEEESVFSSEKVRERKRCMCECVCLCLCECVSERERERKDGWFRKMYRGDTCLKWLCELSQQLPYIQRESTETKRKRELERDGEEGEGESGRESERGE